MNMVTTLTAMPPSDGRAMGFPAYPGEVKFAQPFDSVHFHHEELVTRPEQILQ